MEAEMRIQERSASRAMQAQTRMERIVAVLAILSLLFTPLGQTPGYAQEESSELPIAAPFPSVPIAEVHVPEGDEVREASAAEMTAGFSVTTNTLADEWDTNPNTAKNTKCSLREALQITVPGQTPLDQGCGKRPNGVTKVTINLQGGTYVLTRAEPLPTISGTVEILAQGSVTIDGNGNARSEGIFIVLNCGECQNPNSSADDELLTLPKMKFQNGKAVRGGAIWVKGGAVTAREVTFYRNLAHHPDPAVKTEMGGAVRVDTGEFNCIKCVWRENTSRGTGGALSAGGVLMLLDRNEFIGNHADYSGGAIAAVGGGESYPIIMNSKFKNNFVNVPEANQTGPSAENGGGAIFSHGKMVIEKSEFYGNYTMKSKGGGAIRVNGELRVQDSAFQNNQARKQGNDVTFGGAVLAEGGASAFLVRTSVHRNEAYNGGGLAVIGGELWVVNSTVAQNNAAFDGGLAVNFQPSWLTGEAYIVESTLARNEDNTPDPLAINSANNYSIYMVNSVIDSACGGPIINSGGGNVFKETCARVPWDAGNDQTATDYAATYVPDIGFEGLNNNGGPAFDDAAFMSMKVDTDSPAVDLARAEWCQQSTLVEARDQIGGQRPNGANCDSGAMEVGSKPPKFESTPAAGSSIIFPAVMLGGGATETTTQLKIRNTGGGVIQWAATIDESWNGTFLVGGAQTSGGLAVNQETMLTLTCRPATAGSYYGMVLITTDTEDTPEVRYKLTCHSPNLNSPYAGAQQQPGPYSAGQASPGETTQVSANIANPGSQPLQATYGWKQSAGNIWQLVGNVSAVQAADASATVTISPGDELALTLKCTPQNEGLFSNQLEITTNDPMHPVITYDISCQGYQKADPETLQPSDSYMSGLPGVRAVGLALSPDGKTLIAGHWDNDRVAVFGASPTGQLSYKGTVQASGMSGIGKVQFSPDGKNAYWTAAVGDGVVTANVAADGTVSVAKIIHKANNYICGQSNSNPPIFIFCPLDALDGARGLAISPDGGHVYVAGAQNDALVVFDRNLATGELTVSQVIKGMIAGKPALDGAAGVWVSRDGEMVYVAARFSNGVAVFNRGIDGKVDLVQFISSADPEVTGLGDPFMFEESPDGRFLYVAAFGSDTVVTFARATGDGLLTFVESVPVGDGPYALEMSHDERGERLLVALWQGDGVVNLARDYATGKLALKQTVSDGMNAPTLDGVVEVVSSADDMNTYVALWADNAAANQWTVRRLVNQKHAPQLGNISPAWAAAGSGTTTLTVNGTRFYPGSQVLWDDQPLPTTFVSGYELNATIDAARLASAANHAIKVRNLAPGGGDSAAAVFAVQAASALPMPSIESLNPPAAPYGSGPLNVVVTGAGFIPASQARLNGADVETIYVSPTTLVVMLKAEEVGAPGALALTVVNDSALAMAAGVMYAAEAEAVKTAVAAPFVVAGQNQPIQPAIGSFRPGSLLAGAGEQWIEVTGSGFSRLSGQVSVAYWNETPLETTVLDGAHLLMKVPANLSASAGSTQISVRTMGVQPSTPVTFRVVLDASHAIPTVDSFYLDFVGGKPVLVLSGADFFTGGKVLLNGVERPTQVVNPYVATAELTLADASKSAIIRFRNTAPGNGTSNGLTLGSGIQFTYMPVIGR